MIWNEREILIPEQFYSSSTDAPFERCLSCDRYLLNAAEDYIIEKAVRQLQPYDSRDVIFEYAMCTRCYSSVEASLSQESLIRMRQYFSGIDMVSRMSLLAATPTDDISPWLSSCAIKHIPLEEMSEYQVVALCRGDRMTVSHVPLVVSGEAMEEVAALLSNQTIDELNRFRDRFFDLPPGLREKLRPTDILFA